MDAPSQSKVPNTARLPTLPPELVHQILRFRIKDELHEICRAFDEQLEPDPRAFRPLVPLALVDKTRKIMVTKEVKARQSQRLERMIAAKDKLIGLRSGSKRQRKQRDALLLDMTFFMCIRLFVNGLAQ